MPSTRRHHHHVYVVELDARVWNEPRFRRANPDHQLCKPLFDLSERRELGRVALEDGTEMIGAHLFVADGLVLVETVARDPKGKAVSQSLRMYDWR